MTAYRVTEPGPDASPARPRRPVGAKVLIVLGLLMVAGALVAFRSGTHRVVNGGQKLHERAERLRRDLVVELDVPGRTTVRLRPGRYNIYDLDALTHLGGSTTPGSSTTPTGPSGATDPTVTTVPGGAADPTGSTVPGGVADPTASTVPTATSDPAGPGGAANPGAPPSTPPVVTDGPTGPDGGQVPGLPGPAETPTSTPGGIDRGRRDAVVTITGPDGVAVEQTSPNLTSLADAVGGKLLVQQQVRIERGGTYTVEASGIGGGKVGIGKVESTGEVSRVVGGAFLTIAAVILGGMGVLAAAGGLIWLVAGGRSSPPPGAGPMSGWTPAPSGGFGPTPAPPAGSWTSAPDATARPPLPPPPPPPPRPGSPSSGTGPWSPGPPAS